MKIFMYDNMCVFVFGTDVKIFSINFHTNSVRSEQGGSRNLFFDNENKPSDVTLDFVDFFQFSAHKGSKL